MNNNKCLVHAVVEALPISFTLLPVLISAIITLNQLYSRSRTADKLTNNKPRKSYDRRRWRNAKQETNEPCCRRMFLNHTARCSSPGRRQDDSTNRQPTSTHPSSRRICSSSSTSRQLLLRTSLNSVVPATGDQTGRSGLDLLTFRFVALTAAMAARVPTHGCIRTMLMSHRARVACWLNLKFSWR